MIKIFRIAVFFIILFFIITTRIYAESNYVLPYPSVMPGSLSYKIHVLYENISKYWYFGDFGKFNYNLKMADKYLVEAKTLFEYKQYLLGYNALKKSDFYFPKSLVNVINAENNNKNISQKKIILKQAALKHIEVLERMKIDSPDAFNWQPEKALPTMLKIREKIERSINIRKNVL